MQIFKFNDVFYSIKYGSRGEKYIVLKSGKRKYLTSEDKIFDVQEKQIKIEEYVGDRMIKGLMKLLSENYGGLKISEHYHIPVIKRDLIFRWISISKREVQNCLIFGKGKRFYFYFDVEPREYSKNMSINDSEFIKWHSYCKKDKESWKEILIRFFESYSVGIEFTPNNRLKVTCLSNETVRDIIELVYPRFCKFQWRHIAKNFQILRQIGRTQKIKKELIEKSCHPSRICQIE